MYQSIRFDNYTPELNDLIRWGYSIFDDSWSTYIPEHKAELCQKIIDTYRFNQICCETPDRFIHYINTQMRNIMPYYNKLYESECIKFNPMLNHVVKSNGNSVYNMSRSVDKNSLRINNVMRDFIASKAGTSNGTTLDTSKNATTVTGGDTVTYSKDGTDKDNDNQETILNETSRENQNTQTTRLDNLTERRTGTIDIDKDEEHETTNDETTEKNGTLDKTSTEETTYGSKETSTGTSTKGESTTGAGKRNWTETLDDDSSTNESVNLKESTTSDSTKSYADTPQKNLALNTLRSDYLTNVTWNNDNSQHNSDTTRDTTFADDQTKTHEETYEDGKGVQTNETSNGDKSKSGTDTVTLTANDTDKETENKNGTTTLNITGGQTETENKTTTNTGTQETKNTGDVTTTKTGGNTILTTKDNVWDEQGRSVTDKNQTTTQTNDGNIKTVNSNSESNREKTYDTASENNDDKTLEKSENTDKTETMTEALFNINPSNLLKAFRETFINIDMMIIQELRENFMEVF